MRRKAKVDGNQSEIVDQLRQIPGVSVAVTSSLGNGFTDTVVGFQGRNYLIEIKDGSLSPSRRKLTPDEEKFRYNWKGQYDVCNSLQDVLSIIGIANKSGCEFPLCNNNHYKQGYCIHHFKHYGTPEEKESHKPIAKNSKTRAKEEAEYNKQAKAFKEENPVCQVEGCTKPADHVHHKKGRIGKLLLDKKYWLPVCAFHHMKIEAEPSWAKEKGYSSNRTTK